MQIDVKLKTCDEFQHFIMEYVRFQQSDPISARIVQLEHRGNIVFDSFEHITIACYTNILTVYNFRWFGNNYVTVQSIIVPKKSFNQLISLMKEV